MLINFLDKGLEVITHPAQSFLASKIANETALRYRIQNWPETLTAITHNEDEQVSFKEKKASH